MSYSKASNRERERQQELSIDDDDVKRELVVPTTVHESVCVVLDSLGIFIVHAVVAWCVCVCLASMVYVPVWEEFMREAEALWLRDPLRTRVVRLVVRTSPLALELETSAERLL